MSLDRNSGSLPSTVNVADLATIGWIDHNDTATTATPIAYTGGSGFVALTNDKLGANTNLANKPTWLSTSLFNSGTNEFDWTSLRIGDTLDIRLDVQVTTSAPNQEIEVRLFLGIGDVGAYSLPYDEASVKSSGLHQVLRFSGVYMGDSVTLNNPGQFRFSSLDDASIVVNGWYIKVTRRGA